MRDASTPTTSPLSLTFVAPSPQAPPPADITCSIVQERLFNVSDRIGLFYKKCVMFRTLRSVNNARNHIAGMS
ncbi:exported hypothetical protein [Verrucomicrobia bacterium]|nr:exported hypothetical protein [Verrucomicrobiota bacterium]